MNLCSRYADSNFLPTIEFWLPWFGCLLVEWSSFSTRSGSRTGPARSRARQCHQSMLHFFNVFPPFCSWSGHLVYVLDVLFLFTRLLWLVSVTCVWLSLLLLTLLPCVVTFFLKKHFSEGCCLFVMFLLVESDFSYFLVYSVQSLMFWSVLAFLVTPFS